jgi:hypothetical protein
VAFLISTTVHARRVINTGTFCTAVGLDIACDPDEFFTTKFFKEKFFGGGPGEPGNVLMAKGQGFMLQNVALQPEGAEFCDDVGEHCGLIEGDRCYEPDPALAWQYVTVYKGGMLTLNSKGPWLDKGMLKAKDFDATNYSRVDEEGNLHFCLVIEDGTFRNAPGYTFNAMARFDGTPDNYQFKVDDEGKPVFQRGYHFDALIQILDNTENNDNTPQ